MRPSNDIEEGGPSRRGKSQLVQSGSLAIDTAAAARTAQALAQQLDLLSLSHRMGVLFVARWTLHGMLVSAVAFAHRAQECRRGIAFLRALYVHLRRDHRP